MSADQQTDQQDPRLCWNCGQKGTPRDSSYMICLSCDVTWTPRAAPSITVLDGVYYERTRIEYVDFTKPGALCSPA